MEVAGSSPVCRSSKRPVNKRFPRIRKPFIFVVKMVFPKFFPKFQNFFVKPFIFLHFIILFMPSLDNPCTKRKRRDLLSPFSSMHRVNIHHFKSLKCKKSLDFIYISIHLCTVYIIISRICYFVKHFLYPLQIIPATESCFTYLLRRCLDIQPPCSVCYSVVTVAFYSCPFRQYSHGRFALTSSSPQM